MLWHLFVFVADFLRRDDMTRFEAARSADDSPIPRGFNTDAAARYVGLSTSWLRKARIGITDTPGPAFIKVGRRVIYTKDSLDDFLDAHVVWGSR